MVLDTNLFTLMLQRRTDDPAILDLVPFSLDAANNPAALAAPPVPSSSAPRHGAAPLYTFSRARTAAYNVRLIDTLTQIALASMACPASADRLKSIQMHNPEEEVLLEKKTATFKQEWKFAFEASDFVVRRDGRAYILVAVRKPDPEIDIIRYTPHTKSRPGYLQVLDYNIQRLEVNDRRGLEILAIFSVCHCLDQEYDEKHREGGNIYTNGSLPPTPSASGEQRHTAALRPPVAPTAAQSAPHTPAASSSVDVSSLEPNEILVSLHTPLSEYVDHAVWLLRQDDGEGLHMIVVRADSIDTTPLAVRVAADVKARWYKLPPVAKGRTLDPLPSSTSDIAEELYQYVRDPSLPAAGSNEAAATELPAGKMNDPTVGPRGRIKLNAARAASPASPSASAGGRAGKEASSGHGGKLQALLRPGGTGSASVSASSSSSHLGTGGGGGSSGVHTYVAPPSQLAIYLCKDRIDEFERETKARAAGAARPLSSPMRSGQQLLPASPPPRIPPKKQHGVARPSPAAVDPSNMSAHVSPSPSSPAALSASATAGPRRLLGKLGLRTKADL